VKQTNLQSSGPGRHPWLRLARRVLASLSWNRAIGWIAAELALLSLLWVNVFAADAPNLRFVGRVLIINPTNASAIHSVSEISGISFMPNGFAGSTEIRLRQVATGKYWDWKAEGWSEDGILRVPIAEGTAVPWKIMPPKLSDGRYEVECAVQLGGASRQTSASSFVIDRIAPQIGFFPLHDQQSIADLGEIGGEVDEWAEIRFSICRIADPAQSAEYWDGHGWTRERTPTLLRAASANGYWFPAAETTIPNSAALQPGTYLISVTAFDRAGNEGRAALTLRK
jgi:hypothetical protein